MPNWKKVVVSGSDAALNNITATGDVTVKGDLIAERYIISSSVSHITQSFSSGSTIFGDTLDDTHQFTGSLSITGNLELEGGSITTPDLNLLGDSSPEIISDSNLILSASNSVIISASSLAVDGLLFASLSLDNSTTNGIVHFDTTTNELLYTDDRFYWSNIQIGQGSGTSTIDADIIGDSLVFTTGSNNIEIYRLGVTGDFIEWDLANNISITTLTASSAISSSGLLIGNSITGNSLVIYNNITGGNITGSNISSSGLLFASTSDASGENYFSVLIDTSSGQFYYTSSITGQDTDWTIEGTPEYIKNTAASGDITRKVLITSASYIPSNKQLLNIVGNNSSTTLSDSITSNLGDGLLIQNPNTGSGDVYTHIDFKVGTSNKGRIAFQQQNSSYGDFVFLPYNGMGGNPEVLRINTQGITSNTSITSSDLNITDFPSVSASLASLTEGSGGTSITGLNTQVLFFDGDNNPAGENEFVYNKSTNSLAVTGSISASSLTIDDYIYHNGDSDTNIKFNTNQILITAGGNPQAQFGIGGNRIGTSSLDLEINSNKILIESGITEESKPYTVLIDDSTGQLYKTSSVAIVPNTASYALTSSHALYSSHSFTLSGSDTNFLVNSDSTYIIEGAGGISIELTENPNEFRTTISIDTSSLDTQINNLTSITGSYAVTASNTFTDSQNIQGNITASGNISASGYISASTGRFIGSSSIPTLTLSNSGIAPHIYSPSNLRLESDTGAVYLNQSSSSDVILTQGGGTVAIGGIETANIPTGPLLYIHGDVSSSGNLNIENHITASGNISASGELTTLSASIDYLEVNDRLQGSGSGFQFFAFNEDTVKVKFANWYSSNDRQYGMGQLWFETWFAAIDNNANPALRDERRIGFYLEEPDAGSTDSGTPGQHPTNARFYVDITGSYVASGGLHVTDANFNVESNGNVEVNGDITASGNISTSGLLFASTSDAGGASYNTLMVDTTTGQFYHTGSYGSGGGGGSGTVTSVGGQGTVDGLTLSGTVTTSGSLTLGGAISITTSSVINFPTEVSRSAAAAGFGAGGGGGISFNGSTTNGVVTYGSSTTANVEPYLTFDNYVFEFNAGDASQGSFGFYTDLVNDIEPGSAASIFIGDIVNLGPTLSTTAGKVYNLSGSWGLADANDEEKSSYLLGIATTTGAGQNKFMLKGYCSMPITFFSNTTGVVAGSPIYLDSSTSGTAGQYDFNPPGTGETSRIVGHLVEIYSGDRGNMYKIYFNPSPEWIVL